MAYTIAEDDLVATMGTLRPVPVAESALCTAHDRALYGPAAVAIECDDERGEAALAMIADDAEDAASFIAAAGASACGECGGALEPGELVVFAAAGDLEYNFHFRCCEDGR